MTHPPIPPDWNPDSIGRLAERMESLCDKTDHLREDIAEVRRDQKTGLESIRNELRGAVAEVAKTQSEHELRLRSLELTRSQIEGANYERRMAAQSKRTEEMRAEMQKELAARDERLHELEVVRWKREGLKVAASGLAGAIGTVATLLLGGG